MTEYDKSIVRTRTSLKRFKPKVQNKLVLRGLLDLSEVRDANYWFYKGEELREQENFEEALDAFEKGLKLTPDGINILWSKGYSLFQLKRYKDAFKCNYRAVELENDPGRLHDMSWDLHEMSFNLEWEGFFRIALKAINKALNFNQNNIYHLRMKVTILEDLKQHEEVLLTYDKMIKIAPELIFIKKAFFLHRLGRYKEAIKVYDKLIELEPNDPSLWYWKAKTFIKMRHYTKTDIFYDGAITAYSKAIEEYPNYQGYWYERASIFSLKGDKLNALEDLSKTITLDSSYKEDAREDEFFKVLWEDNDFKQMTR